MTRRKTTIDETGYVDLVCPGHQFGRIVYLAGNSVPASPDVLPSNSTATRLTLGETGGFMCIDPSVGAYVVWVRQGNGAWEELHAGQWVEVCSQVLYFSPTYQNPEFQVRMVFAPRPSRIVESPLRWSANILQKVVDVSAVIATGSNHGGKPTGTATSVVVSDSSLRYAVLDGSRGAKSVWIRTGGSTGEQRRVWHGEPFPLDGTNFEVWPDATDLHSIQVFELSPFRRTLGPLRLRRVGSTLALSAGALSNFASFVFANPQAVSEGLVFKAAAGKTFTTELLVDAGDGTAPAVVALAAIVATGTHQRTATGINSCAVISVRCNDTADWSYTEVLA